MPHNGLPPPPRQSLGLKKGLSLEVFRSFKKQQAILHPLSFLLWECSLRCDLACAHCGSDCQAESSIPDMPLSQFIPVLQDIKRMLITESKRSNHGQAWPTIGLTGGEPSLRPDIIECGEAIRAEGFPWGMVSNGNSMTASLFDGLIKAGLGSLTISLDGLEGSHEKLRGKRGSFKRALASIEMAAASNINMDVVSCVNQANLSELEKLKELLMSLGVKRWRLFSIFPRGRAALQPWLRLDPLHYLSLMEKIAAFRKEGGINVNYGCEGYLGEWEGKVRDYYYFCRAGVNFASILVDGSVTGCTSMRRDFIQGNIHEQPFSEIWRDAFQELRDRSWTKSGPCATCPSYRHCQGNGLHLWIKDDAGRPRLARCNLAEIHQGIALRRAETLGGNNVK